MSCSGQRPYLALVLPFHREDSPISLFLQNMFSLSDSTFQGDFLTHTTPSLLDFILCWVTLVYLKSVHAIMCFKDVGQET
jgi:hypothetical protein